MRLKVSGLSAAERLPFLESFVAFEGVHDAWPEMAETAETAPLIKLLAEKIQNLARGLRRSREHEQRQQQGGVEQEADAALREAVEMSQAQGGFEEFVKRFDLAPFLVGAQHALGAPLKLPGATIGGCMPARLLQ